MDCTRWEDVSPYESMTLPDHLADLRLWQVMPLGEGQSLPAGVLMVFCKLTRKVGLVLDATKAEAALPPLSPWPESHRVRLIKPKAD